LPAHFYVQKWEPGAMLPPQQPFERGLSAGRTAPLAAHLLGLVDFDACLALQHRLVYESAGRRDGHITLLICEHPTLITIGRNGSRADIHLDKREMASRRIDVRWVNRGGGAVGHAPGQLAIYPIVPLATCGYTVGQYLDRLQQGLVGALDEAGFSCQERSGRYGVWGRAGQVATIGAAVRNWVSYFGAYVNVCPEIQFFRRIDCEPVDDPLADSVGPTRATMSSLVVERQQPVRMSGIRERLVRRLADAFGCDRYHLFTGHPLLARSLPQTREASARVG
jgi:lipoyl(octanoyl) transferase